MIRARRLFLIPAVFAIVLLIPIAGLAIYLIILAGWYVNNSDDLELYFRGINYKKNEYSNEDQLK